MKKDNIKKLNVCILHHWFLVMTERVLIITDVINSMSCSQFMMILTYKDALFSSCFHHVLYFRLVFHL